ncbi:MAG: DUF2214 domain-containing protein, partial [Candidatus Marinimicrobia bacterium CG_4_9_14_3_um_filter_48_9]
VIYYLSHPLFLIKRGLLILVVLLSIYPTKSFLKLRKTKTELSQPLPEL